MSLLKVTSDFAAQSALFLLLISAPHNRLLLTDARTVRSGARTP